MPSFQSEGAIEDVISGKVDESSTELIERHAQNIDPTHFPAKSNE